jgi:hypothetical protein
MFPASQEGCLSKYSVYSYSEKVAIEIDGRADEAIWQKSLSETNFSLPWDKRNAPETSFKALLGPRYLYLFFSSSEDTLLNLHGSEEDLVALGDRVEVFLALDSALSRYFCLEISPSALVLDYEASYYRKFRAEWDLPGLRVAAIESPQNYTVEAAIPLASLLELGFPKPAPGTWIRVGLFRADFVQKPDGVEQNWISWCLPNADHPDFHVPSAFGFLEVTPVE